MAFPANPNTNQLHSARGEVWRYNNNTWFLIRNYPSTTITVGASGVNTEGGYWETAIEDLRKPIAPGKPAHCAVNMYNRTGGAININVPAYAKFSYFLYDYQGNQLFSSNYVLNVMDSYEVNRSREGFHFNFPLVLFSNKAPAKSIRFRCDWQIPQGQPGAWQQWKWRYQVTSA